jgi:hypothetical protein
LPAGVGSNVMLPPLAGKVCHNLRRIVESFVKSSVTGNPEIVKQGTLMLSLPVQLHFQGPMPEPETGDAVPAVQSPVVGAVKTRIAAAGPHWPDAALTARVADDISRRIRNMSR